MPMAIGLTPMWAGHGFLMRISAGRPTTMAAGLTWPTTAGSGSPAMTLNGDQPGCPGELEAIMSAGRRCHRAVPESPMRAGPLAAAWTSNWISVRLITIYRCSFYRRAGPARSHLSLFAERNLYRQHRERDQHHGS